MQTDEIKLLFEYNFWADQRILETCAKIDLAQYTAPAHCGTGYGSLRATLVHELDTVQSWRNLCQKGIFSEELTEVDLPDFDALVNRWQVEQQEMQAYLGTLDDADLNGVIRYTTPTGILRERILWHCLLHVVNHSTQHRSEAAALLTNDNQSPGDLDFTLFMNERGEKPA